MNKGKDLETDGVNEKTSSNTNGEPMIMGQNKPKSFEDVYDAMGPPGRYQIVQISMIFSLILPMAFLNIKYAFLVLEPEYSCIRVNETELLKDQLSIFNDTGSDSYSLSYEESCEIEIGSNVSGTWKSIKSVSCKDGYNYTDDIDVSIITEWDLVCDRQGIGELSQAVIAVGSLVGSVLASMASDRFGRKLTIVISLTLTNIFEVATAYAPDIYSFIGFRFVSGIFLSGVYISTYVLGAELLPSKYREMFIMLAGAIWSVSNVFLCGVAYIFRNYGWRDFQLYSALIVMVPMLFLYSINESASWLHSVGKYHRCEKIVKQACRVNKVDFDVVKITLDQCFQSSKSNDGDDNVSVKPYSVLDLFRYKRLFVVLSITFIAAFTNELTYSGLFLTASNLVGNFYLNMSILGVLGVPGCFMNWVLLKYRGRRFVLILCIALTAICLLISTILGHLGLRETQTNDINLTFFLLGKFTISACYNTLFLYIPETFPTSIRTSGTGIASSGANVGGAIAPYLLPLSKISSWAPGTILTVFCFLTAILFILLPETRGKQLETTMVDDKSITASLVRHDNVQKA